MSFKALTPGLERHQWRVMAMNASLLHTEDEGDDRWVPPVIGR